MGGTSSSHREAGLLTPDIFAILHEYLLSERQRAFDIFQIFTSDGKAARPELSALIKRLMPDVTAKELDYFMAMINVHNVDALSFEQFEDLVRMCRQIGANARSGSAEELKRRIQGLVGHSVAEATRVLNEFDIDRAGYLPPGEVVEALCYLNPGMSDYEQGEVLAQLYLLDSSEDGRVRLKTLLHALSLDSASFSSLPTQNYPPASDSDYIKLIDSSAHEAAVTAAVTAPTKEVGLHSVNQRAKLELREAVRMHKEHEERLTSTMRVTQESICLDVDELRRDERRLEEFVRQLDDLSERVSTNGGRLEGEIAAGCQRVQEAGADRETQLTAQAGDITAERLAMLAAQKQRTQDTIDQVRKLLKMAEGALEEKDPYVVLAQSDKFEAAVGALRASGRCGELDAATTDDLALHVDFDEVVAELRELLEFMKGGAGEGVQGPLRGAAAMRVLKQAFASLDPDMKGAVRKDDLMRAMRSSPAVVELLKLPAAHSDDGLVSFEDTFRRIDTVDPHKKLTWPEFASFFGASLFKTTTHAVRPMFAKSKAELIRDLQASMGKADECESALASATKERMRLEELVAKQEGMLKMQEEQHTKRVLELEEEKKAQALEFEAKLMKIEQDNAAKQADFEARLHRALERSEAVLRREDGGRPSTSVAAPAPTPSVPPSSVKPKSTTSRPLSATAANRTMPGSAAKPALYNGRAVSRDADRTGGITRLQEAGTRLQNRNY